MSSVCESIKKGLDEAIAYEKGGGKARTMKLTVEPVRHFRADEVKKIRNDLGMTQSLFAGFIGVSQKTVEAWESGKNVPNGPASRILSMVQADPQLPERYNIVQR